MAVVRLCARGFRVTRLGAAAAGVLALAGCAASPVQPPATSSAASRCQQDARDWTPVGAKISADVTAEFAGSHTDEFRDFRALLVSVCGKPIVQRYDKSTANDTHNVASVTKSIVSTLVGTAIADGLIKGVDQTLVQLLPQHAADMTPAERSITLRQLLTMTAGLDKDGPDASTGPWIDSTEWVSAILREGSTGTGQFGYSSATSHLLAAILVRATGRPLIDYAREKLFDPLGIATRPAAQPLLAPASATAYDKAGFAWPLDHQGINFGAGYVKLTPSDMLKLGQLYLDGGRIKGRQVVPAAWVHDATTAQVDTHSGFGGPNYGYQWWVTSAGSDPAFAAVGFGGQLIEVVPHRQLVVVFSTKLLADPNQVVRVDAEAYEEMVGKVIAPRIAP